MAVLRTLLRCLALLVGVVALAAALVDPDLAEWRSDDAGVSVQADPGSPLRVRTSAISTFNTLSRR